MSGLHFFPVNLRVSLFFVFMGFPMRVQRDGGVAIRDGLESF